MAEMVVFEINGQRFSVEETEPGQYLACSSEGAHRSYTSTPVLAHKAVVMAFLETLAKARLIDHATASWPEAEIREVGAAS